MTVACIRIVHVYDRMCERLTLSTAIRMITAHAFLSSPSRYKNGLDISNNICNPLRFYTSKQTCELDSTCSPHSSPRSLEAPLSATWWSTSSAATFLMASSSPLRRLVPICSTSVSRSRRVTWLASRKLYSMLVHQEARYMANI
jgi:hypothetical protein